MVGCRYRDLQTIEVSFQPDCVSGCCTKSLLDFRGHKCCNFDFNFTNFCHDLFQLANCACVCLPVCFGPLAAVESKHKLVLNYAGTEKQSRIERYRCHIREVSVSLWFPPSLQDLRHGAALDCVRKIIDCILFSFFIKKNRSKQLKIAVKRFVGKILSFCHSQRQSYPHFHRFWTAGSQLNHNALGLCHNTMLYIVCV